VVVEENRARTRGAESILLPNTFIVFDLWAATVGIFSRCHGGAGCHQNARDVTRRFWKEERDVHREEYKRYLLRGAPFPTAKQSFCSLPSMSSNFDFTDKTQEALAAAIQLAKDYANAHGMYSNYVTDGLPV